MSALLESITGLLQSQPAFLQATCALFGLLIGSFLNVVIYRLPKMMEQSWQDDCLLASGKSVPTRVPYNLLTPGSGCPSCGHRLRPLENIPVLSFLWLSGKCKACHSRISWRYPLVELTSAGLSYAVAAHFGYSALTVFALLFIFALLVLTLIDFDTQLLPDSITLPLLWLGLLCNLHTGFTDLSSAVIGAMAGYLTLWSIYWLFKLVTGKEGMGHGDFKLLAAIGAWFGWQQLPAVILLSSVAGSVIGIALIVLGGRDRRTAIPFGPFLAIGGMAALFFGQAMSGLYLLTSP